MENKIFKLDEEKAKVLIDKGLIEQADAFYAIPIDKCHYNLYNQSGKFLEKIYTRDEEFLTECTEGFYEEFLKIIDSHKNKKDEATTKVDPKMLQMAIKFIGIELTLDECSKVSTVFETIQEKGDISIGDLLRIKG